MGIYNRLFAVKTQQPLTMISFKNDDDVRALLALTALKSNVMIADGNNVIVSLNASVEAMLREAEADIRKELPHFSVSSLRGASMDVFHKNPSHQTAMLARLQAPHEAAIKVGGREFMLTAIPLFEGGRRLGTAIEWQDDTEKNALKRLEVERQQKDQARSEELSIITTALDTVSSNVMMADPEGIIFYTNKSVVRLLKTAEADIRQVLPSFSADNLVGKSFDTFHRNPAHQQSLLTKLTSPYEAAIRVGPRHFHLKAAPVSDPKGKRLGTVVEWLDRTAEIQLEEAVENTIKAAISGDLGIPINQQGHTGFIAKIATSVNQLLTIFNGVLSDAEGALNALAHGNLCKKITNPYQGRYNGLKSDINTTIEKLTTIVDSIEAATVNVMQGTQEISEGINSLSQRTEQQAASLEETSAAMEQITRTVEQTSQSAVMANDLSKDARAVAEEGGNVLERAIASMNAISESSRKIEEIISVIDGIAFQTNLLALNAAVEAARAGDHGRGFAVVASEVRSLAGRSAKAAKEIKDLIRDSGNRVQEGSALVNKTGETFSRIILSVKKVNSIVDEITNGSKEQATGLSEINKAVQDMDEMTQQNAALVEEAAATSESLYERSVALGEMMKFFNTGKR